MRAKVRIALVGGTGLTFESRFQAPDVDARLRDALSERGVDVCQVDWKDTEEEMGEYDLACVRTTWDYTTDPGAFLAWADLVADRTRLVNPPETLRWGASKEYLSDLAGQGLPTVPTLAVDENDAVQAAEEMAKKYGSTEIVMKPYVGVGADRVFRVRPDLPEAIMEAAEQVGERILLQPYRPSILDGEVSIILLDGEVSHAVRKTPAAGDFRVQSIHGGTYRRVEPADLTPVAVAAAAAVPGRPAICRVDMIVSEAGPEISEVEVVEPDLYLGEHPAAAERLADILIEQAETTG